MNKPDCLKLFSTTFDISAPMSSSFNKSLNFSLEASELDNYETYGYKSNKTGINKNKILSIKDTTPMPHNGTRPPKKRRV